MGIYLEDLLRKGKIYSALGNETSGKAIAHRDWIDEKLYRVSRTINILDTHTSKRAIDGIKEHINNFCFFENDLCTLESWELIKILLEGKFSSEQKEIISRDRDLARFVKRIQNKPDLLKAWDAYSKAALAVDFQFDQVSPILKQTINPRVVLKQKGFI